MKYVLKGGTIVTPDYQIQGAAITVENGRIASVGNAAPDADHVIELSPTDAVFPALINPHDHMLGTYYPRVGTGPYINWLPWDNDLKSHPLYTERSSISNQDLYLLSAYKNIISGVTTVSDHIPHTVNEGMVDKMPLRVIRDYTLEHECSSYDLRWGRGITTEHSEAKKRNIPFITHIEEGYDEEATLGLQILKELKALDEHTVMVHGISFSDADIDEIAKKKAHVVWCPTSNYYMFKDTTNIKRLLEKGVNVCLGTDSPMSGGLNIFEEMQFAAALYKQLYHEDLEAKTLVKMVTTNPAKAFRLNDLGRIEAGMRADLLVISDADQQNPWQSLVNSWFNSIRLVTMDGQPLYGSSEFMDFFKLHHLHCQRAEINGKDRILVGKPIDLYKRIWKNVGFKKILPFFPVEIYA